MFYLKEINVANPSFWYSMVLTSMSISEASSNVLFGKYMDKTRNARFIMLFNLILSIVGNVLYTFRYSVWFLVIGRFLCGFGEATQPIACGELKIVDLYLLNM